MNVLIALMVTLVAALGSGGVVVAAQDDLPGEPLYEVKTFTEDARLFFSVDPLTDIDLLMEMTQERLQEIIALAALGQEPPAQVATRWENQIAQALQIAAGLDDPDMMTAMEQIRAQIQLQTQQMTVLQNQAHGETQQSLERLRTMLETRLQFMNDGMADPQGFRYAVQAESNARNGQDQETGGNGQNNGSTSGQEGNGAGSGPGTPQGNTNGNGQGGPGSSSLPSATPWSGGGYGGGSSAGTAQGYQGGNGQGGMNPSITPTCTPMYLGPYGPQGPQGGATGEPAGNHP